MPTATTQCASLKDFTRVPVCVLEVLESTSVDLYIQYDYDQSKAPILYRAKGYPLSEGELVSDPENCKHSLFVKKKEFDQFSKDLNKNLEKSLENSLLPLANQFELLQSAISLELEQSVRLVDCDDFISHAENFGKQVTTLISQGDLSPSDMFDIVRHDYQTFVHVTNVAAYAGILAKLMGCVSSRMLEQIAVGALLHDLGKKNIPRHILNKTTSLTPEEWRLVKMHPQTGYEDLKYRENITHGQLMMAYQHHEKLDGTGYPVGITDKEIHPWSKILAVVDVFDALTGERPYRRPCTAEEALQLIEQGAGTHFDKEIVQCWAAAIRRQ